MNSLYEALMRLAMDNGLTEEQARPVVEWLLSMDTAGVMEAEAAMAWHQREQDRIAVQDLLRSVKGVKA